MSEQVDTGDPEVAYMIRTAAFVKASIPFDKVAAIIGEDKANEICNFRVSSKETRTARVGKRSAIPPNKRFSTQGLAEFNKRDLVEAINEVRGKDYGSTGNFTPVKGQALPNPDLLPDKERGELEAQGYFKPE